MSLTRTNASAVNAGAQHVPGPLPPGAQGGPVLPQGTLPQPTQQPQPLSTIGVPIAQTGTLHKFDACRSYLYKCIINSLLYRLTLDKIKSNSCRALLM